MRLRKLISWTALFGTSLGLHAVGFARLDHMGGAAPAKPASKVAFMEMTSKPKPSAPSPEPPKADKPVDRPAAKAVRRVAAVASHAAPVAAAQARPSAAPPPAAETLADFSGTTLTNGSGAGWASATGNGERLDGPIGRPGARVTGRHVEGASQPARAAEPALVAVADLSRKPEAPALQDALERNYPTEARQTGQGGKAVVKARITADGSVRDMLVVSETSPGFGRACRDTLAGSRWTPPLDRDGKPVSTIINYTCRFEVR